MLFATFLKAFDDAMRKSKVQIFWTDKANRAMADSAMVKVWDAGWRGATALDGSQMLRQIIERACHSTC